MARLLLHIGSPKTGSSAIQLALTKCASQLTECGIYLPREEMVLGDSELGSGNGEWLANFCTGIWPETSAKGQLVMQRLEAMIANQRNTVLSSENFYYSNAEASEKVWKAIHLAFEKVAIVLYVRNPVDMCFSLWLQGVKRSFAVPLEIATYASEFDYTPLVVIQHFKELLPGSTLNVRNYDQHKLNLVPDFLSCISDFFDLSAESHAQLQRASLSSGTRKIVNRSLFETEVQYMQLLTRHLSDMLVPEENIFEAKRISSDLLLLHNTTGYVPSCPPDIAELISCRAQSAVDALNEEFDLALESGLVAPSNRTDTTAPNEFVMAAAAVASGAFCRIPPSSPVVYVREGDNFEFEGYVDHISSVYVSGWVVCKTLPKSSVLVLVDLGGRQITLVANIHRPDVAARKPNYSTYCGFYHEFDSKAAQLITAGHKVNVSVLGSSDSFARANMGAKQLLIED